MHSRVRQPHWYKKSARPLPRLQIDVSAERLLLESVPHSDDLQHLSRCIGLWAHLEHIEIRGQVSAIILNTLLSINPIYTLANLIEK